MTRAALALVPAVACVACTPDVAGRRSFHLDSASAEYTEDELRESVRYRGLGFPSAGEYDYMLRNIAHSSSLADCGMTEGEVVLLSPEREAMTEFERAVLTILANSHEPLTWHRIEVKLSDMSLRVRPNLLDVLAGLRELQFVEAIPASADSKFRYQITEHGRSAIALPSPSVLDATPAPSNVQEIAYDYGNAMDPISRVGRLVLKLSRDGSVALVQTRGRARREWRARQSRGLWDRFLELLRLADFPRRPTQPTSVPPGTPSYGVSWTLGNGDVETVRISAAIGPDSYRDISNVMFIVIGQIGKDIQETPVPIDPELVFDVSEVADGAS